MSKANEPLAVFHTTENRGGLISPPNLARVPCTPPPYAVRRYQARCKSIAPHGRLHGRLCLAMCESLPDEMSTPV
jgi:hypothetical protein